MWQLPLTNLNTLRFGRQFERGPDRGSSGSSSEQWHLCNLSASGGGISCKPVDAACRAQKHRKFLAMAPGQCSLWRDAKDTKVFAVCAGPPDSAQVLVMAADSVEEADKWVCSIAGRLYLSELQLEEEMITDYISIYYIFDTDGKGGISLDELQAASEGLGNPRSEHGHLTEELNATLTRLQIKTDAQGLISLPQFLKVCPLHDARVSRQGLPQPFPPISHTGAQGGAAAAICLGRGLAHAGLPLARRGRHGIDQPGGARSMVQRCARHGTCACTCAYPWATRPCTGRSPRGGTPWCLPKLPRWPIPHDPIAPHDATLRHPAESHAGTARKADAEGVPPDDGAGAGRAVASSSSTVPGGRY